jgi:hypothetical protein
MKPSTSFGRVAFEWQTLSRTGACDQAICCGDGPCRATPTWGTGPGLARHSAHTGRATSCRAGLLRMTNALSQGSSASTDRRIGARLPVGGWSYQARHIGPFWRGLMAGQQSPATGRDSPGHQARPAISMPRGVPPPVRSGSGRPPGCAARLLGLGPERLQLLNGWPGVCEHAGEGRFHPRVGQVLADPACGIEPGSFHPG